MESLEGTVGGEAWVEKIQKELETDMDALTATRDTLSEFLLSRSFFLDCLWGSDCSYSITGGSGVD